MTRYTVVWHEHAEDQLAQVWMDSADRDAVTAAAHRIDQTLAVNPDSQGEAVHEGLRNLTIPPLTALFAVEEPDRIVRVLRIRLAVPHPGPEHNGPASSAD